MFREFLKASNCREERGWVLSPVDTVREPVASLLTSPACPCVSQAGSSGTVPQVTHGTAFRSAHFQGCRRQPLNSHLFPHLQPPSWPLSFSFFFFDMCVCCPSLATRMSAPWGRGFLSVFFTAVNLMPGAGTVEWMNEWVNYYMNCLNSAWPKTIYVLTHFHSWLFFTELQTCSRFHCRPHNLTWLSNKNDQYRGPRAWVPPTRLPHNLPISFKGTTVHPDA